MSGAHALPVRERPLPRLGARPGRLAALRPRRTPRRSGSRRRRARRRAQPRSACGRPRRRGLAHERRRRGGRELRRRPAPSRVARARRSGTTSPTRARSRSRPASSPATTSLRLGTWTSPGFDARLAGADHFPMQRLRLGGAVAALGCVALLSGCGGIQYFDFAPAQHTGPGHAPVLHPRQAHASGVNVYFCTKVLCATGATRHDERLVGAALRREP